MTKPTIRIYTTVNEFIDREMTNEEFAQYQKDTAEAEAKVAQAEAKVAAKAELLKRLGITEAEAKLLLS